MTTAVFGFLLVAPLAAGDGGYWPTAWGWASLGFAWVAIATLVLRREVRLDPREVLLLAAAAAFLAWIVVGLAWSDAHAEIFLEAQRATLFVTALLAAVVVVRSRSYRHFLGGLLAGIWVVSAYALATRLFPDRLGTFDPIAGYRLSEPIGYWNALGIFAALGLLLGVGFAIRGRTVLVRSLAAASLVTLTLTLYFTFSRGAWLGLVVGVAATILADPRRLHYCAGLAVSALAPAAAVALAYGEDGLTRPMSSLSAATAAGHDVALAVVALTSVSALVAAAFHRAEMTVEVARRLRLAWAGLLVGAALCAAAFGLVHYGGPTAIVDRAWASFTTTSPEAGADLNRRLFSLSSNGRIDLWRTAARDAKEHAVAGSGAGSFEAYWLQERPYPLKVRDAHSLYVETLAELGPIGLALLLCALLLPLAAVKTARRRSLVPVAVGAYSAFLLHAGIDWDWEITALTLTGLACGVVLVVAARSGGEAILSQRRRLSLALAAVALSAFAFVGLVGNTKLSAASAAAASGDWAAVERHARSAKTWMPWSPEPWRLLGQAELVYGRSAAARKLFAAAVAKEPRNWELWLDVAVASQGEARRRAVAEALALNPLEREVAALAKTVKLEVAGRSG